MRPSATDGIRALLAGYEAAAEQRARAQLIARLSTCANPMIFGAGQNGRLVLSQMREAGLRPTAFIDETPAKFGTSVEGVPVIAPGAASAKPDAFVICSIFSPRWGYLDVARRLQGLGLESAPLFAFLRAFATASLPFYFLDTPASVLAAEAALTWLAERLVDRTSLDLLHAQIAFRLGLRYEALPPWTQVRIPPPAAWSSFAAIDAGAFDGDTLLPLLAEQGERAAAALALEPDAESFARLERNIVAAGRQVAGKTRAFQVAVDASSGRRAFRSLGHQGSGFDEAGAPTETASIDDLVETHLPTHSHLHIKFDVEGAEADALRGAARTIATRRPFLAVSAYHQPDDLWTLPRLISELGGGERFRLGSHGADGADLVLYTDPSG